MTSVRRISSPDAHLPKSPAHCGSSHQNTFRNQTQSLDEPTLLYPHRVSYLGLLAGRVLATEDGDEPDESAAAISSYDADCPWPGIPDTTLSWTATTRGGRAPPSDDSILSARTSCSGAPSGSKHLPTFSGVSSWKLVTRYEIFVRSVKKADSVSSSGARKGPTDDALCDLAVLQDVPKQATAARPLLLLALEEACTKPPTVMKLLPESTAFAHRDGLTGRGFAQSPLACAPARAPARTRVRSPSRASARSTSSCERCARARASSSSWPSKSMRREPPAARESESALDRKVHEDRPLHRTCCTGRTRQVLGAVAERSGVVLIVP